MSKKSSNSVGLIQLLEQIWNGLIKVIRLFVFIILLGLLNNINLCSNVWLFKHDARENRRGIFSAWCALRWHVHCNQYQASYPHNGHFTPITWWSEMSQVKSHWKWWRLWKAFSGTHGSFLKTMWKTGRRVEKFKCPHQRSLITFFEWV